MFSPCDFFGRNDDFFGRNDGFINPVIPVWFPGMEALARETLINKRQMSTNCMKNE